MPTLFLGCPVALCSRHIVWMDSMKHEWAWVRMCQMMCYPCVVDPRTTIGYNLPVFEIHMYSHGSVDLSQLMDILPVCGLPATLASFCQSWAGVSSTELFHFDRVLKADSVGRPTKSHSLTHCSVHNTAWSNTALPWAQKRTQFQNTPN